MSVSPPPSAPPPELAAAVRSGRWQEVAQATRSLPGMSPAVAVVAARAARAMGRPDDARSLALAALPAATDLAPALRLEAAHAALELGEDPFPHLEPLLDRRQPFALRRAAGAILRAAAERLPLGTVSAWPASRMADSLARDVAAHVAIRSRSVTAALGLVSERSDDGAAVRAARWLAAEQPLPPRATLDVADALLIGGRWREAESLLATVLVPSNDEDRFRHHYLSGRAAYRLGRLSDAAPLFEKALAAAVDDEGRYRAAVQRARVAELTGDLRVARDHWDRARAARPSEVEGWDGGARVRAALGLHQQAAALLRQAPGRVLRSAGPRLVAQLLRCGQTRTAASLLDRLGASAPVLRVLRVARATAERREKAARAAAAKLLADPRNDEWRELVLEVLPAPVAVRAAPAARSVAGVADIAAIHGAPTARAAAASLLAGDPRFAVLLTGSPLAEPEWSGPARALVAVGLEREAAQLFPESFPSATPAELAWSAARLAEWGNGPAALTFGERVWIATGLPAALVPDELLPHVLPAALIEPTAQAARAAGVSPSWLAGIIRRESRFDARARSGAGALGIAQLMPETARRLGATGEKQVWEPDAALVLAGREIARLSGNLGPRLSSVSAAYNAGEGIVATWLAPCPRADNPALVAAMIPYRETADYVLAVHQGAQLARWLHAGERQASSEAKR